MSTSPATSAVRSKGRFFRANLWLHRWASLVATPFFLVLCITGAILIFHEEIDEALGYVPAVERAGNAAPKPLADIVAAAQKQLPELRPISVFVDIEHPERTVVGMAPLTATKLEEGKPYFYNSYSGEPLGTTDFEKTPTGFILELHANWFAGFFGQLFGGLIALLVLISLISGVVVYAPYVRKLLFGMIRRGRGTRLVQLDLHNFIGAVVLGWALVVTITGVALALGGVALAIWQSTELKEMATKTPVAADATPLVLTALPVTIDQAVTAAQAALPDKRPYFLIWPGTDFSSPRHYMILMSGTQPYDERLFDVALIDAGSGQVADARPLPLYLKAILISEPLHFGDYGGLPLKLLWVASSLLTLFITGNGAWLWWARRRRAMARTATAVTP